MGLTASSVDYDGASFFVHPTSMDWWTPFEVDEYLALLRLNPTDRVLDIGGNVGIFAIPAARRCAAVAVYEPDAGNYQFLTANLVRNAVANVQAYQAAVVGDHAPAVAFYQMASSRRHSLVPAAGAVPTVAPAVNIDVALQGSAANVVKLDAEGAELALLTQGRRWGQVDRMVFEYHEGLLGDTTGALWQQLRAQLAATFAVVIWRLALFGHRRLVYCSRWTQDVAAVRAGWPGIRWMS